MGDNLVGDDILTKQYFPRVYMEERKELGTGLISGGTNNSLVVGGGRRQQTNEPGNCCKEGLPTK
jgi:hypothetical protein